MRTFQGMYFLLDETLIFARIRESSTRRQGRGPACPLSTPAAHLMRVEGIDVANPRVRALGSGGSNQSLRFGGTAKRRFVRCQLVCQRASGVETQEGVTQAGLAAREEGGRIHRLKEGSRIGRN